MNPELNQKFIHQEYLNSEELSSDILYNVCVVVQSSISSVEDFSSFLDTDIGDEQ